MSERDLLVIFHYGGQLVWDNGSPVYNRGSPKMAFLKRSLTYSELVQKICDISTRNMLGHIPNIQYLHQNGKVCTLAAIKNDDDLEVMLRASAGDGSAVYLYIQPSSDHGTDHQWNEQRLGYSKAVQQSSPPSVLGKRDAAGQALYRQECDGIIHWNEDANWDNTLPSPKVNPTKKVSVLDSETSPIVHVSNLQQSYPPVDLGADFELPFTSGCYTFRGESENPSADNDAGLDIGNDKQHYQQVDEENRSVGEGYPDSDHHFETRNDRDNLVTMQMDTYSVREKCYTVGVDQIDHAERTGEFIIDVDTLESLHVATEICKEGNAGYDQGFSTQNEEILENIQTRDPDIRFRRTTSNGSEAGRVLSDRTVGDSFNSESALPNAGKIVDTMQAADELLSTPPHEDTPHAMWKGRVFSSRDAFKSTLAKFAMYTNFCLKPLRTNRFEATTRCSHPTCPWRIHASIVEAGPQFQVRTYTPDHNCSGPMNGVKYPQATSVLIAEWIKERLRVHQDYRPKEIMSDFHREFGVQVSYRKAHLAREIAMKHIRGSFEHSYKILCDYRLELNRTNPGTVDNLWTEDDHSFQRYYVCFGACARSFKSSIRPLIALDRTHLRGKYPGSLLIAVCQDGDHGLFPLAFGIVESECYATWSWFLACLDETLEHVHNLTIVSDRMKGLTSAVMDVLPNAKHCYCCRHISQNIQAKFKNDGIVMKFWCAARSTRVCEYDNYMAEIISIDVSAHDYINAIGRQHWANAFIEGQRYDMLTTNIAESTNSLLKDIRELPITQQIESVRAKLMDFYQNRREKSLNMKTRCTPYVDKIITRETKASRRLQCWQAGEYEFQVLSPQYTDVVHLDKRSCTCRRWDLLGIPCSHGLCAINLKRYDPYDFCAHWFSNDCYRATYNDVIHATRDVKQWGPRSDEIVLPPRARRQPGRPKKCRIRTEDRMRKQVTCSHYKKRGHNRQTCREPPPRG